MVLGELHGFERLSIDRSPDTWYYQLNDSMSVCLGPVEKTLLVMSPLPRTASSQVGPDQSLSFYCAREPKLDVEKKHLLEDDRGRSVVAPPRCSKKCPKVL